MPRYFVMWCLEDDVEQLISTFERHGDVVGLGKVHRHVTDLRGGSHPVKVSLTGSAEVRLRGTGDLDEA